MRAGEPVGSGAADMLVTRGEMKAVEIVMGAPGAPPILPKDPPPDPPGDPGAPPATRAASTPNA